LYRSIHSEHPGFAKQKLQQEAAVQRAHGATALRNIGPSDAGLRFVTLAQTYWDDSRPPGWKRLHREAVLEEGEGRWAHYRFGGLVAYSS
jgi:hypothetical protein